MLKFYNKSRANAAPCAVAAGDRSTRNKLTLNRLTLPIRLFGA
jgi:hypothetical protein